MSEKQKKYRENMMYNFYRSICNEELISFMNQGGLVEMTLVYSFLKKTGLESKAIVAEDNIHSHLSYN